MWWVMGEYLHIIDLVMAHTAPHWRGYFLEYDDNNYTIVHQLNF